MQSKDLFERLARIPRPDPNVAEVPPAEIVAVLVQWWRHQMGIKKSALAERAKISLSTLERIERAEQVSLDSLERLETAFGLKKGYITAPRFPNSDEEVEAQLTNTLSHLDPVAVKRIRTQPQVRELAECHGYLPYTTPDDEVAQQEVAALVEWFDFGAFMLGTGFEVTKTPEFGRRRLYTDILEAVRVTEKRGFTVLGGIIKGSHPNIPEWNVAVLAVSSKAADPGAAKRRSILVDRRVLHPSNYSHDLPGISDA